MHIAMSNFKVCIHVTGSESYTLTLQNNEVICYMVATEQICQFNDGVLCTCG